MTLRTVLPPSRYSSIIFDMGDVLFTWSDSTPQSPLPPATMKGILQSLTWFEYEKGNLTEEETFSQLAKEFSVNAPEVKDSFRAARDSLQTEPTLLQFIRDIKASGVTIYGMSNISAPDWEYMKSRVDISDWSLFERVFTSAEARERKPNLGFYQYLIRETGLNPETAIFIDDKVENVLTARSMGMCGIVFDDIKSVIRQLRNLCEDSIHRARSFLAANKKKLKTISSGGDVVDENFSQLLLLEMMGDESMVDYVKHDGKFNFFQGEKKLIMTPSLPDDLDTTSIALTVASYIDAETKNRIMDEMLTFRNGDGIVQTYFDHTRPRIDPVVCVNVLTLFYRNGRGYQLEKTLDWVEQVLIHGACASGTLYYVSLEQFFFFLSRLIRSSRTVQERLEKHLRRRVAERFGADGDALALAMRIYAAATVRLIDHVDLDKLLMMQQPNGSWTDSVYYKFPSVKQTARNDGITTAIAIHAIEAVRSLQAEDVRLDNLSLSFTTPVPSAL